MSSGRDAAPSVVFAGALYPPVNKTLLYVESIVQQYCLRVQWTSGTGCEADQSLTSIALSNNHSRPMSRMITCGQNVIICRKYYQIFMITIIFIFIRFQLLVFAVELYPPKKQESIIILIVFAVAVITMIIAIFTLLVFAVRYIHLWKTKEKTKQRGREGGQGRKER